MGSAPGKRTLTETLGDVAPVQRRASGREAEPASAPPAGPSTGTGSGAPLPAPLQHKMENVFAFNFGNVRVHEGARAAAMGAAAYTQGSDLHFAPGEYQPDNARGQELIGHELAHVVQQSEGRVAATTQYKGVDVNDDHGLESEADAWGMRAARGEAVGRAGASNANGSAAAVQRKVIQRSPQPSHWGRFVDTAYTDVPGGASIHLTFEPGASTDATKIGLTQSVRTSSGASAVTVDPQTAPRQVASGPGAGYEIDRVPGRNDPVYGSPTLPAGSGLANTPSTNAPPGTATPSPANATFELGHHFTDASGPHTKNAWMSDTPTRAAAPNTGMEFETTALALEGAQQGAYYGSVRWGWQSNASGTVTRIPFTLVSEGVPSQNFLAAAGQWNSVTAGGTLKARNNPTQVYSRSGSAFTPAYTIPQNTVVTSNGTIGAGAIEYVVATIGGSGSHAGSTAYIRAGDLADQNDGLATIDLPVPDVHTLNAAQTLNDGITGSLRYHTALPVGTRVVQTTGGSGTAPATKVWVRVVAGPHTDEVGWVDRSALTDERP